MNGGRVEYVISVACIVGKSRMKGYTIPTYLVPYGPEMPKSGMVKEVTENEAEILWYPPNGDFKKYLLCIQRLSDDSDISRYMMIRNTPKLYKETFFPSPKLPNATNDVKNNIMRLAEHLSTKATSHIIPGLEAGEKYAVLLLTKNGEITSKRCISDVILTRPPVPTSVKAIDILPTSITLEWTSPDNISCLKGFEIKVDCESEQPARYSVSMSSSRYKIPNLDQGKDYKISIKSVCTAVKTKRSESDVVTLYLTTPLERVKNLKLSKVTTNSIAIKWDPPSINMNLLYSFTIISYQDTNFWVSLLNEDDAPDGKVDDFDTDDIDEVDTLDISLKETTTTSLKKLMVGLREFKKVFKNMELSDTQFEFEDLPNLVGAGMPYQIGISAVFQTSQGNNSEGPLYEDIFLTRPYPPSDMVPYKFGVKWTTSITSHVTSYRIRWITTYGDDSNNNLADPQEATVAQNKGDLTRSYVFASNQTNAPGIGNSCIINIAAIVDFPLLGKKIFSHEISQRFVVNDNNSLSAVATS